MSVGDEKQMRHPSPSSSGSVDEKHVNSKVEDLETGKPRRFSAIGHLTSAHRTNSLVSAERIEDAKHQDPFIGDEHGEVHYRTLRWWQASIIMSAETVSTGILTLPSVHKRIGLVPASILTVFLGALTTYSGYVIWQFRNRFPFVHTFADAGEVLFAAMGCGAVGREFFGFLQIVVFIFSAAAHVTLWTTCLNTLSDHATCSVVWSVVGLVVFLCCGLPRTLKKVSWLASVSLLSIVSACLVLMIAVGVDPPEGAGKLHVAAQGVIFYQGMVSTSNVLFAFAGHCALFNIISELRDPDEFPKALYWFQGFATVLCLVLGVVVYVYAGNKVVSPALGTASPLLRKVGWGLAIPTIVIAGVIYGHMAVKYVYVRLFRGSPHLHSRSFLAISVWFGLSLICWVIAWVIAESIPVFNDLLAIIAGLVATWFTFGFPVIFWMFINWGKYFSTARKTFVFALNIFMALVALTFCFAGLYASGYATHVDTKHGASVWSCADNGQ